jgi:hypothetical protein
MKKWLTLAALLVPVIGQSQSAGATGAGKTVLVNQAGKVMGDLVFGTPSYGDTRPLLVMTINGKRYGINVQPNISPSGEASFNSPVFPFFWSESGCTGTMLYVFGQSAAPHMGLNVAEFSYVASTDKFDLVISESKKAELRTARSMENVGVCTDIEGDFQQLFFRVTKRIPWSSPELFPRWVTAPGNAAGK